MKAHPKQSGFVNGRERTAIIRRLFARLCLAAFGFGTAFVLAEIGVRVFAPHVRDHVIPSGLFSIDAKLGWKLTPQKTAIHGSRYFEVTYSINTMGCRDRKREPNPSAPVRRLLLYGDSQVFGWGVEREERFSDLLESTGSGLEVWNMAVPGYGLDQQVLAYADHSMLQGVNGVIFFVSSSTLQRTRYDFIYQKPKPQFELKEDGSVGLKEARSENRLATSILYQVLSPFYLPYFVERRLELIGKNGRKPADPSTDAATSEALEDLEKGILRRASELARGRQHEMTVISDLNGAREAELRDFCASLGVEVVELNLPEGMSDLVFGEHDWHWNSRAHRIIADRLAGLHISKR